jgi:hypothetical protein
MCDATTSNWISGSYYISDSTTSNWLDEIMNAPEEIIPYKRKPHFRYNLQGWFNVKLAFYRFYELGLQQGIKPKFRLLRFKDGFV